ncbi:hypothetical protein C3L33_06933, partial [Rhododendron williamsianum]
MSGTAGDAALFLIKVAALETLRRFSKARCPVVWCGIQALQALCYPPLRWIQRWAPFKGLISSMQGVNYSQASSESNSELPSAQSTLDTSVLDEAPQSRQSSTNWLSQLYEELEKQGINLPERINEDELHRFYIDANCDLPCLLSSVKKTILWRKTFYVLSGQELEMWSNMVFWHGVDVNCRPCLIIRLGLASAACRLMKDLAFFKLLVEHGILHLVNPGNPRITVLVDCQGLSPLRFPMQMMRSCFSIFQEHFPGRLGFVFVIRVPPVVRVIAHTVTKGRLPEDSRGELSDTPIISWWHMHVCKMLKPPHLQYETPSNKRHHETERKADVNGCEDMPSPRQSNLTNMHMNGNCDQALRASVIAVLVFWVLIAFLAGIYNPESHLALPF